MFTGTSTFVGTMIDDCNSFGITMYEILNGGIVPFSEYSTAEVVSLVTSKKAKLVKPENCPEVIFQLILRCTSFDREDRPSFKQVHLDTCRCQRTECTHIRFVLNYKILWKKRQPSLLVWKRHMSMHCHLPKNMIIIILHL
jgi:serine/threonine protein kinase